MTHPLAARVRHWKPELREWWEELAGRLQFTGRGCSREESEARAEALIRAWWEKFGDGPVWTTRGAVGEPSAAFSRSSALNGAAGARQKARS